MFLKLNLQYNKNNKEGDEVEILDLKRDESFSSGIAVLVFLNGRKKPEWLTVDWFV